MSLGQALDDFVANELSDLELNGLVVLAFDNGSKLGNDSLSNWDDSMLQLNRLHHLQLSGLAICIVNLYTLKHN